MASTRPGTAPSPTAIEPPRYGTILTYTDFMDWRVYYGYKLAEDLKMRNEAVKEIDPSHVTTSHAPILRPLFEPWPIPTIRRTIF
jgi:beta-galactosidase